MHSSACWMDVCYTCPDLSEADLADELPERKHFGLAARVLFFALFMVASRCNLL
jgi:hypothetical protein